MTNIQNEPIDTTNKFHEQTGFWLQIVDGWKREINRVVEKSEGVNGSPEVTAEVARIAGELSVLADQLDELYTLIGYHSLQITSETEPQWKSQYADLSAKLHSNGEKFRNLLSEMFRLDKAAYRKFLC